MCELLTWTMGDKALHFMRTGRRHEGIQITVRPFDQAGLESAIAVVNSHGGPAMWRITEL